MRQDKRTPFSALSLGDVQRVSAGDTLRAGSYFRLVSNSRSGYASRTLVPERFANERNSQLGLILPAQKTHWTEPSIRLSVQRTSLTVSTLPCVVKARAGLSADNGGLRLRLARPCSPGRFARKPAPKEKETQHAL